MSKNRYEKIKNSGLIKNLKNKMWEIVDGYYIFLSSPEESIKVISCTGLVETKEDVSAAPFVLSNRGHISGEEFNRLSNDIPGLERALLINGYMDIAGYIQEKFMLLKNETEFILPDISTDKLAEIYKILKNALNKNVPKKRCPFSECQRRVCLDDHIVLVTNFGWEPFIYYATCTCVTTNKRFVLEITLKDVNPFTRCVLCGSDYIRIEDCTVNCGHCLKKYVLKNLTGPSLINEWYEKKEDIVSYMVDSFVGKLKEGSVTKKISEVRQLYERGQKNYDEWPWPWVNKFNINPDSKSDFDFPYPFIEPDLICRHDIFLYKGMSPIDNIQIDKILNNLDSTFLKKEYSRKMPEFLLYLPTDK